MARGIGVSARCLFVPDGRRLGATISVGATADASADISTLEVGARRCDARCCTWTLGLLNHGAVHLERACFDRDEEGPFLVSLSLVDG